MKTPFPSIPARIISPILLVMAAADAAASSVDFDSHIICKSRQVILDRQPAAGIISAHCVVDIRLDNLKDRMKDHILSGDATPFLPPAFRGSASALLVMPPMVDGGSPQSSSNDPELQPAFQQPFQSLSEAMADFTGGQVSDLGLGDPPPWDMLAMTDIGENVIFQTSFNMQSLNPVPQAVVPLPPAAGLLLAGTLLLASGLRRQSCRSE